MALGHKMNNLPGTKVMRLFTILSLFLIAFTALSEKAYALLDASLTCPSTLNPSTYGNCQLQVTTNEAGTLEVTWNNQIMYPWNNYYTGQLSTNTSTSGASIWYYGPGTGRVRAYVKMNRGGFDFTQIIKEVFVTVPSPLSSVKLVCPSQINPTEAGQCVIQASGANIIQADWSVSGNGQITPNVSTADVIFNTPGQYTVNVTANVDVAPTITNDPPQQVTLTAPIEVLSPQILVTVNCPSDIWIGQTGNCSATGWSSWGTVRFIWSSSGTTVSNNETATVKFTQSGQGTVTATAYIVENPFITKQQTVQVNVNVPALTAYVNCPASLWSGQPGNCSASGTTQWGTLGYRWTSTGSISGNENTANVYFQDIGPGSVTLTAYLKEAPSVTKTAIAVTTIADPMVNVTLDCPQSLWITQNGTCKVSGSTLFGTMMYTWNSTGNVTPGMGNTASVNFASEGMQGVTVTGYLLEAPGVTAKSTADIVVNAPQITAQLNCPASMWIGEPGKCSINAATDYGTLTYKWNSSGALTSSGENATVTFNQTGTGNVSVEVSLLELPNIKISKSFDVAIDAPQITGTITCPQSLWVGEPGNCIADASADWGTIQYEWSTSSGNVTPNGNNADVIFTNKGEGVVSVKLSLAELPAVNITMNASITINSPDITVVLVCPQELWKNMSGTCTVNAAASWGTLQYEWTSSGTIVAAGNTADVSFPAQGSSYVTVKVSILEVPTAGITEMASIYVNGYRKPAVTITGDKFVYVKETREYSIKDVYSPSGPVDVTWNIDEDQAGTGESINYTFNEAKKVLITVTARVKGSGDDPDALGVNYYNVYVNDYPLPRISVTKPYLIFINEPVTMTAKVYVQSGLDKQLYGRWVLPDNSYLEGDTLIYTFTSTDIQFIKYEAWFEGHEGNIASRIIQVRPREYVFPDFNLWSYSGPEGVVPHYALFKADGDMRKAVGKKITYNWDFGDGTTFTSQRSRYARKVYDYPGSYTISLQAIDQDGNVDNESYPVTLTYPDPIKVSIRKSVTNRYNKAPLGVFLTVLKSGGHPRDRISAYSWKLGDEPLSDRYSASARMESPGEYNLSLDISTKYGYSSSTTEKITVNANKPPVTEYTWEDRPSYKITYFTANCTDSDGRIVKYNWDFGNGQSSMQYRPYLQYKSSGTYPVTLTCNDDSGSNTSVTKSVSVSR